MTSSPPLLERASKAAAVLSVAAIMVLFLWLHPDQTWQLRVAGIAAFVLGWFASGTGGSAVQTACLLVAPLAPAALRALTGREGPVLDLVWMAVCTASIIRGTAWTTWSMPAVWRLPAGAWTLALALAWPVVALREVQFDPIGIWELGRVNGEAGLTAAHAVMWTFYVVWTSLIGVLWLDVTSQRLDATSDSMPMAAHGLWVGGTIASLVALYQGLVDMTFANTAFWADQGRATGTMLDANAYGVVAALSGPLAFRAVASSGGRVSLVLAVGVLLGNIGGVWLSGSRTAALCVVVGLVGLAGSVSRGTEAVRRLVPVTLAGIILMVLVLVVGGKATGPVRRMLELPDSPRQALSAIINRGPYGTIAALMIVEHPVAGVGGGYNVIAPDYYRRLWGSGLPFDNAQNWWRQALAEGGLLGSAGPIVLSALLAWCVLRVRSAPGRRRQATLVRGLLLALGLASGIQAPTQAPILMLWFTTLAGWLPSVLSTSPSRAYSQAWPRPAWVAALALAVAFAAAQTSLAVGALDPAIRASRTGRTYVAGAYRAEALPESESETGRFNWTTDEARFTWPVMSPWLMLRFWTPHPDIEASPVRVTITSSCGPVFDGLVDSTEERFLGLLRLPRDVRSLSAEVRVSRTWQPSSDGVSLDTRRLGVALVADFASQEEGLNPKQWVDLTSCRP